MPKPERLRHRAEVLREEIGIVAMIIGFTSRSFFEAMGVIGTGGIFPGIYFWILVIFVLKVAENSRIKQKQNCKIKASESYA